MNKDFSPGNGHQEEPPVLWQHLAGAETERETPARLRMSSAGKCVRALTYAALSQEETDRPDRTARNRMSLGHMAEILIVQAMEHNGWETAHTVLSQDGQLELQIRLPRSGRTVSGHPDGICRHPRFTNNLWVTLECKSMSPEMADRVEQEGVLNVYPAYLSQIALYGAELRRAGRVSHPEKGVFGMMDRNGRALPPERVSWQRADRERALSNLDQAAANADNGELPPRPYERDSFECGYCSYHRLCWGSPPRRIRLDPEQTKQRVIATEREQEAARLWQQLNPQLKEAKNVLQHAVDRAGGGVVDTGAVLASYFTPKKEKEYDEAKLRELVPADILRRCRQEPGQTERKAFWVREASKK